MVEFLPSGARKTLVGRSMWAIIGQCVIRALGILAAARCKATADSTWLIWANLVWVALEYLELSWKSAGAITGITFLFVFIHAFQPRKLPWYFVGTATGGLDFYGLFGKARRA